MSLTPSYPKGAVLAQSQAKTIPTKEQQIAARAAMVKAAVAKAQIQRAAPKESNIGPDGYIINRNLV